MSSNACFRHLRIDSFRGFADPAEIDINASAVILAGPNGTGKTSVFDAVQWLLLGRVKRLEGLRARKNVEHIVNQYRVPGKATVEADLIINGVNVLLKRQGNQESSTLEMHSEGDSSLYGESAQTALERLLAPQEGISLDSMLMTSGLLQQDVMRLVLEAKASERYEHMRSLLGLTVLDDFETQISEAAKQNRDLANTLGLEVTQLQEAVDRAEQGVELIQSRVRSRPTVAKLVDEGGAALDSARDLVQLTSDTEHADWAAVAADASRLAAALADVETRKGSLEEEIANIPSDVAANAQRVESELQEIQNRFNSVAENLARDQKALHDAETRSQSISNLASIAIPLLEDHCPVCHQRIDPHYVRSSLEERAREVSELVALREGASRSLRQLQELEEQRRQLEASKRRLDELVRNRERAMTDLKALNQALVEELERPEHLRPVLPLSLQELKAVLPRWAVALANIARSASAIVTGSSEQVDLAGLRARRAEWEDLGRALDEQIERAELAKKRASLTKQLSDASVEASVTVTQERFQRIQPLVADIYGRLDPHPSFKVIEFLMDTYYRHGTSTAMVRDVVEDRVADPLVVFATSQANIAALSYFLAMGFAAGDRALPHVMLDDPLQSMDDVNVLAFADLCRYLRMRRQLIISTHEQRFAHLLERKLAPRAEGQRTVVIEFQAWDRSGPFMERREIPSQLIEADTRLVSAG